MPFYDTSGLSTVIHAAYSGAHTGALASVRAGSWTQYAKKIIRSAFSCFDPGFLLQSQVEGSINGLYDNQTENKAILEKKNTIIEAIPIINA